MYHFLFFANFFLDFCIICFYYFCLASSCWMSSNNNLIWIFVSFVSGIEIVSKTTVTGDVLFKLIKHQINMFCILSSVQLVDISSGRKRNRHNAANSRR